MMAAAVEEWLAGALKAGAALDDVTANATTVMEVPPGVVRVINAYPDVHQFRHADLQERLAAGYVR